MTFSYIKILLMFLVLSIVFTSCDSTKQAVIVQPESEEYELPLEIWSTITLEKLSMKKNYCVIDEGGNPIEIGTKVLVLEKAVCVSVKYKSEPPIIFPTGMVKIRVIDTGQEGWIWSTAAKLTK